jgi:Ulp1 family protease
MKKSTDPFDKLRSALGDKPLPKEGRCPHQPDGFECGVLTCWNMEKLLEVPDGGAIEYDYCLVERYRYLILFRILGCVNQ